MAYEIDKPKKNWVTMDSIEIAPKSVSGILMPVEEKDAKQIIIDTKAWNDSSDERKLEKIRKNRNDLLNETDWKIIKAIEQENLSEEFTTWRQNLRDIPQDYQVSDYDKLLEVDEKTSELKHSVWQEPKG
jgi:hypothetical protein